MSGDSREETQKHIERVAELTDLVAGRLEERSRVARLLGYIAADLRGQVTGHDASKLDEPEASIFDEFTPKLKRATYGSEEYMGFLEEMNVALDHHYGENRHHPEHFPAGMLGMTLVDLVEMFCDWLAATERHDDGDIFVSITKNQKRFNISPQIAVILENTARMFGKVPKHGH